MRAICGHPRSPGLICGARACAELEFFQVFYEILMECTGILAHEADGGIVHGRNMDIGLAVTNITTQMEWKRGGTTVMQSTQYLGYVGVHTGMRMDGWSVQANERVVLTPGPMIGYKNSTLALTLLAFGEGHSTVGGFLRSSLLSAQTFEEALPLLENTKLASPMYLIVGGKDQGRIITRDRSGLAKESQDTSIFGKSHHEALPRGAAAMPMHDWFLLETNWDPWVNLTAADCKAEMASFTPAREKQCEEYIKGLYNDLGKCTDLCQLYSDGRREAATTMMRATPGHVGTKEGLLSVLSTSPVLAGDTKFSSIMSAASGHYSTLVRNQPSTGVTGGATKDKRNELRQLFTGLTGLTL